MTATYTLTPPEVSTVRALVNFTNTFAVDVFKLTSDGCVGIDDPPTLVVFGNTKDKYVGPEMFLNRLPVLEKRLGTTGAVDVTLELNDSKLPVKIVMSKGKATTEFSLGTRQTKLPRSFTGTFMHEVSCSRADLKEIILGAKQIGGPKITIQCKGGKQLAICSNLGESFKYVIGEVPKDSPEYSFNYHLTHIVAIDKLLPPSAGFIGKLTPKGQMLVDVATAQVTAQIFILDIKER